MFYQCQLICPLSFKKSQCTFELWSKTSIVEIGLTIALKFPCAPPLCHLLLSPRSNQYSEFLMYYSLAFCYNFTTYYMCPSI